jgi:nucleoside-diphosphate-sugar epimerase
MLAHSTTLDITAAKTELGYQPKVSVEEGVERFLRWWMEIHH